MAEEKTILTLDLYNNVLTEKSSDFTDKSHISGIVRPPDISICIVKKHTEYHSETIAHILDLSYDKMIKNITDSIH